MPPAGFVGRFDELLPTRLRAARGLEPASRGLKQQRRIPDFVLLGGRSRSQADGREVAAAPLGK